MKAKQVPGKYINNKEYSQRERNIHSLKLSSIFRNEQEHHDEQHISRTLNIGDIIKEEQINLDQMIARKIRDPKDLKDENFYSFGSTCSWGTGSSLPRMPQGFTLERERTIKTWRTWRNINDSYAYSDVSKYIEENELLPEDKEKRISQWIDDVYDATNSI